jgi:2-polyprenyl-6-hydroxyphenyl methylase/3-demethylubiquinone-9 3-methyltransferase
MNCYVSQTLGVKKSTHFDFGENWKSFSDSALNPERIARARADFHELMQGVILTGRTFLDVGFGQGLAICLAKEARADVYGNDINPTCLEALRSTVRFFPDVDLTSIPIVVGSILDDVVLQRLGQLQRGGFDIVYSWGVLHHTGAMDEAIRRTASLVKPGGSFVLAIYNTHWSSPVWGLTKRMYNRAPPLVRRILVALFLPLIFAAKFVVTRRNPLKMERGMSFYHDVVDWIGGYPYEHRTKHEVRALLESLGFRLERSIPATVPTGCNQFVFRR